MVWASAVKELCLLYVIVGGRLEKVRKLRKTAHKKNEDVNDFYKSESKINRVSISHEIQGEGDVSVGRGTWDAPPENTAEWMDELMNEWINDAFIKRFIVYSCTPKALYNNVGWGGVSPQPPPVCSIHLDDEKAAKGQQRQCAHHTPATGGEERET